MRKSKSSKPSSPHPDAGKFEEIHPPDTLRAKVGYGSGMDPAALSRAEAAVEELSDDFVAYLFAETRRLTVMFAEMTSGDGVQPRALFLLAHELRGQAGSFGYPLIGRFCETFCKLIENKTELSPRDIEIAASHIDALRAVIQRDIKGDGGEVGRGLAEGLESMVAASAG